MYQLLKPFRVVTDWFRVEDNQLWSYNSNFPFHLQGTWILFCFPMVHFFGATNTMVMITYCQAITTARYKYWNIYYRDIDRIHNEFLNSINLLSGHSVIYFAWFSHNKCHVFTMKPYQKIYWNIQADFKYRADKLLNWYS